MHAFCDFDDDLLDQLLAAMSKQCHARALGTSRVRKAIAAHKAQAEAPKVGGGTNTGQTEEEAKDVSDTSMRDAQIKDSRGGLGGGSNRGVDANSARGSGSHSPMAAASEDNRNSTIVIAQLRAENERMRALNQVRVPRAMWRDETCLSMRVVPIPPCLS